jgi:hypothetical protein
VTEVFDICGNIKYVQLFNSVLFLETKVYMVGYHMLTLQSPGMLLHVHCSLVNSYRLLRGECIASICRIRQG